MIINELSLGMLLTAKKIHYSSYMSISSSNFPWHEVNILHCISDDSIFP